MHQVRNCALLIESFTARSAGARTDVGQVKNKLDCAISVLNEYNASFTSSEERIEKEEMVARTTSWEL